MTARIDKADVRAALTPGRVLDHFGIDHRRAGGELRFQICPECGPRTRDDSVSVNASTGRWRCLAHECSGDLFAMVAGYAGIDLVRDFSRVVEVAADIAGVG